MDSRKVLLVGAACLVPVLFLIRNLGRLVEVEADHAASEQRFDANLKVLNANEDEGAAFGKSADERGCLKETLARTSADAGWSRSAKGGYFVKGCLRAAAVTPAFCDSVPGWRATMTDDQERQSRAWQQSQCASIQSTDWTCRAQLKFVQLHCHPLP